MIDTLHINKLEEWTDEVAVCAQCVADGVGTTTDFETASVFVSNAYTCSVEWQCIVPVDCRSDWW